jgi:hypothetical protein
MEEMPQDCLEQSRPPHPCGLATHGAVAENTEKTILLIQYIKNSVFFVSSVVSLLNRILSPSLELGNMLKDFTPDSSNRNLMASVDQPTPHKQKFLEIDAQQAAASWAFVKNRPVFNLPSICMIPLVNDINTSNTASY